MCNGMILLPSDGKAAEAWSWALTSI